MLVEPSGAPLAGVVVVALDFDSSRLTDVVAEPEENLVVAALAWTERQSDESVQLQRLGSVITDAAGRFSIQFDDDLFKVRDSDDREVRPDIVLVVLAPDVASETGVGLPLAERLLYSPRSVQFTSGRVESFVIRVPEDRLTQLGVTPAAAAPTISPLNIASLVQAMDFKVLEPQQKMFGNLLPGLLGAGKVESSSFIGFSPTQVDIWQSVAEKFRTIPWLSKKQRFRSGRVYLTPADLELLGLTEQKVAAAGGTDATFGELLDLIGYSGGPYRNRHLLSQLEVRRTLAALNEGSGSSGGGGPAAPASKATEGTVRDSVLSRLQEQSEGLSRSADAAGPADDLSRIRRIVEQLEQSSGMGNAAATHDVDILQVAWEPTWVAAFDDDFIAEAQALYRATVDEQGQSLVPDVEWDLARDVGSYQVVLAKVAEFAAAASAGRTQAPPAATQPPNSNAAPEPQRIDKLQEVGALAKKLNKALKQPYSFQYFATGSVNYGILQTYRQSWSPIAYQVGRVVDSIPLTPSEIQTTKLQVTVRRRKKRTSKETNLVRRTSDESSIGRTEIEAMEKTAQAMSAQVTSEGKFNIGIGSIGGTSTFNGNTSAESQRVHKSFAEMSRKASQEVRRETEVQYEIEVNDESVSESTRTLHNANDEMTITYVLYELERRYRVQSQLQAVQPVLLVAMPMPKPNDIDDAWLIEHAWIIRDVLLDRVFEEALDLLEDHRSQDEQQLAVLKSAYDAAFEVKNRADYEFQRLATLIIEQRTKVVGAGYAEGTVPGDMPVVQRVAIDLATSAVGELLNVFGGDDDAAARAEAARKAAERTLEYLDKQSAAATEARDRATETLNQASTAYSTALAGKAMVDQKILQLRLHVRGNVFHYLHEVWRRKDPDELFFSLYDVPVPFLPPVAGQCKLRTPTVAERDAEVPGVFIDGELYMVDILPVTQVPAADKVPQKRLVEIADLDRPLGFKGNYAIFPLRVNSLLTDLMMVGFLDGYYGVRDPALDASYSAADLLEYAKAVWNDPVANLNANQKKRLTDLATKAGMRNPGYEAELALPTGKVWMEALKGGQALLEPFKLAHRGLDVLKVEEEVRRERIENLRRIQRIGLKEAKLDDPDIEKVTIVRGIGDKMVIDAND